MKKQMGNNGVTMISLVVTIIVLLILSAITINTLSGENGILSNSGTAKKNANSAEEIEILNTSVAAAMGASSKAKVEETKLRYFLNQNVGNEYEEDSLNEDENYDGYTLKKDEDYEGYFYVQFLQTKNKYTITEDGQIISGTIEDEEKLKLKKTALTLVTGETYELEVESNAKGEIEWKSNNQSLVTVTTKPASPKEVTVNAIGIGRTS